MKHIFDNFLKIVIGIILLWFVIVKNINWNDFTKGTQRMGSAAEKVIKK